MLNFANANDVEKLDIQEVETPLACAIREAEEECGIKKLNIKKIMAVTTIMVVTIITIIAISKSTAFNNS